MDNKQKEYTEQELNELRKKVSDWVQSAERQKALQEAIKNSDVTIKDLREKSRVDPESLSDPITI